MEKNEDFTVDECIKVKPPSTVNINHNGFTSHPPLTQLLPPFFAISAICLTVVEIHETFESILIEIILDLLLFVFFIVTTWLWYCATSIVPTDTVQLKHLAAIEEGY